MPPKKEPGVINQKRFYLSSALFKAKNTPGVFEQQGAYQCQTPMQIKIRQLGTADHHEVVLTIQIKATRGDFEAYECQVDYAGVFELKNMGTQLNFVLQGVCVNMLYPYACQVVSDLVMKGGFPQLLLPPKNFELIQQQVAQQESQRAAAAGAALRAGLFPPPDEVAPRIEEDKSDEEEEFEDASAQVAFSPK